MAPDLKSPLPNLLLPSCCGLPGKPMHPQPAKTSSDDSRSLEAPMPSFTPRPFPPPSLADIPVEYIAEQLRLLAPLYWNKSETADCTIIVPVPHPRGRSMCAPDTLPLPPETTAPRASRRAPSGLGRRVTEPTLLLAPRISLELHIDYLSAQSTFLRALFSGASPLNLINTTAACPPSFDIPPDTSTSQFIVPANRLPRLLPSPPEHPVLFLPVPDPTSFHLLVHWMYFGCTDYIEDALYQGIIQWDGIARNVEYLDLRHDIKIFLGAWYGNWLHPEHAQQDYRFPALSDDDVASDYDGDDSSTTSNSRMDEDSAEDDDDDEILGEPRRGRTTSTRFLEHLYLRPRSA